MQEELEEGERAFKRQKQDQARQEAGERQELERIKEEGRRMMKERKEEMDKKAKESQTAEQEKAQPKGGAPTVAGECAFSMLSEFSNNCC